MIQVDESNERHPDRADQSSVGRRAMRRSILALFAVLVFAAAAPYGTVLADAPAPAAATATFERDFMSGMIDHHTMANEMATVCQQKQVRSDLASLCSKIITDQTREIGEMQGWLQAWYSQTHEPMMMPEDMAMLAELRSLNGAAFETRFITMMIEHHSTAIERARECSSQASHEGLRGLCGDIITAQTTEIQQMRAMLAAPAGAGTATPTAAPAPPRTGSGAPGEATLGSEQALMLGAALVLAAGVLATIMGRRKIM